MFPIFATMQGQDNIHGLISYLPDRLNVLEKVISEYKNEIYIVKSDYEVLKLAYEALKHENEELKSQLAAFTTKKDSRNSSKPPSSDFGKPNRTNSLRKSSTRKMGGQQGHKGSSMKMVSEPDFTVEHHPSYCKCCGNDLTSTESEFIGRRQVFDIPDITPFVTEHRVYRKVCSCGRETKGTYSKGVNSPVSYGANTQALVAYLSARQYIPFKRQEELLRNIFGLDICQGSIKNIIDKMCDSLGVSYETIRKTVLNSSVIGCDETSININGKNHWVWTFQNNNATFIGIHPTRGYAAITGLMPEGFKNTTIVSDCWASYFKTGAKAHQICTAHILRELQYFTESNKEQTWSNRMSRLIRVALKANKKQDIGIDTIARISKMLRLLLVETIQGAHKKLITLKKRLIKYQDYLFLFLSNKLIPPDNNGSERALRNFKVKQKVSGFFKTEKGAKNYAILRSVCDTAIKNSQNPLLPFKIAAACGRPE